MMMDSERRAMRASAGHARRSGGAGALRRQAAEKVAANTMLERQTLNRAMILNCGCGKGSGRL
jgi:hypothetical protein